MENLFETRITDNKEIMQTESLELIFPFKERFYCVSINEYTKPAKIAGNENVSTASLGKNIH